jgi:hypothetical protein
MIRTISVRSGIVTVRDVDEHIEHAGMGIAVAQDHVLTCAHVVNAAMGRNPREASRPNGITLRFAFPDAPEVEPVTGHLVEWLPPPARGNGNADALDAALFELKGEVPAGVGIARLAALSPDEVGGKDLSVYGMISPTELGGNVRARAVGVVRGGSLEISGSFSFGRFIDRGFSGGAVWCIPEQAVVGMVTSIIDDPETRTGYAVPVIELAKRMPQLDVEHRYVSETTQRLFSILGIFAFVLMLVHAVQIPLPNTNIAIVPWAHGARYRSGFFGTHAFFFMLPVYALILRHALSFRINRPWYVRLPSLFGRRPEDSLRNERGGSMALLVFVVVLALYAQLTFMHITFDDTTVLVASRQFADTEFSEGFTDDCRHHGFCVHRDVGHFSFLGSPWTFASRKKYWDTAYRIAQASDPSSPGVTFFPVLQPLILIAITAFGALQVGAIFAVLAWPKRSARLLLTTKLGLLTFKLRRSRSDVPLQGPEEVRTATGGGE